MELTIVIKETFRTTREFFINCTNFPGYDCL